MNPALGLARADAQRVPGYGGAPGRRWPGAARRWGAPARTGRDAVLPTETLIAAWPFHEPEPARYRLSNLPADTPLRYPVRMA
ncbi:hypothetical protein [Streptomonospora litoralis]|uniref:hypothetical protein n=1 Tax=Streptomonospora litoralis TaxID=2498135 RepID=UPI001035BD9F|nr:hypothetical protein [Streptomonospora litoralis]